MAVKQRLRIPAFQAPQPDPARPIGEDPTPRLAAMYRRIWETSMHDMPFVNRELTVEVVGFQRWRGDWVGAAISPWFLNLFVLPGGGELWSDLPSGERCNIAFPVGELEFIADDDVAAEIPAYQYCALITQVSQFASQEAARAVAAEALKMIFVAPPVAPSVAKQEAATSPPIPIAPQSPPSRRAFFRRVAGH